MSDDLVKRYREMQVAIGGCHDGYCVIRKPQGMHTNGGCNCLEDMKLHERSRVGHLLRCSQQMAARIEELEAERDDYANRLMQADNTYTEMHLHIEELEAKLAKAENALFTLSHIHDGNPSDARADILPLDYARHMLWEARNIARTTLAELKGQDDE